MEMMALAADCYSNGKLLDEFDKDVQPPTPLAFELALVKRAGGTLPSRNGKGRRANLLTASSADASFFGWAISRQGGLYSTCPPTFRLIGLQGV